MGCEIVTAEEGEIRVAVKEAVAARDAAMGGVENALKACVRAGALLAKQREEISHGRWLTWLEDNVPHITPQTALKWIKLARFAISNTADLENAGTVREAYKLAGLLPESEAGMSGPSSGADFLVQLTRVERVITAKLTPEAVQGLSAPQKQALQAHLKPFWDIYNMLASA